MGTAIEVTKAYLEANDFGYEETDDGMALRIGVNGLDNMGTAEVLVIFDEDDESAGLRIYHVGSPVPKNKKQQVYKALSKLNNDYRWVKFSVDEDDDIIEAAIDTLFRPENAGVVIFELIHRLLGITDEAYPAIMKALWGGAEEYIFPGRTLN